MKKLLFAAILSFCLTSFYSQIFQAKSGTTLIHFYSKSPLEDIEAANKENAGGNSDLRKSIQKLKAELGTVRLVLDAAKLGKPYLALRPTKIDPWLLTEEKNRLLKAYSGK